MPLSELIQSLSLCQNMDTKCAKDLVGVIISIGCIHIKKKSKCICFGNSLCTVCSLDHTLAVLFSLIKRKLLLAVKKTASWWCAVAGQLPACHSSRMCVCVCICACHLGPSPCCESSGATKERWLISLQVTCFSDVALPSRMCVYVKEKRRDVDCVVSRCAVILWIPSSQGHPTVLTHTDTIQSPSRALLSSNCGHVSCIYNIIFTNSFVLTLSIKLKFLLETESCYQLYMCVFVRVSVCVLVSQRERGERGCRASF